MNCEELAQLLAAHRLSELPPDQRAAVGEHLVACEACRAAQKLDEQSQPLHDAATPLRARDGAEHSLLGKLDANQVGGGLTKRNRLAGFELLGRLGKGGMGTVLKARQLSMDRLVALKILPRRLAEDQDFVARFFREARSAARLRHPHIVQAFDVGQAEGYYYFAMEYVDGEGPNAILQRDGPFEAAHALRLMK
ncbi:MAG: protein kinase [Candidatus Brocadiae bacterium]|nr:protein kinase [Candidatus Brocadiia bacterium]